MVAGTYFISSPHPFVHACFRPTIATARKRDTCHRGSVRAAERVPGTDTASRIFTTTARVSTLRMRAEGLDDDANGPNPPRPQP
jgi:hypothetical protein